jgi:acyl-CoA synthetase (NDP forming)
MTHTLSAALTPASIAIVGASDNPNKVGGRPLLYLSRFGFAGRVYPINPHRDRVQGFQSYPSIASLPESPDLVIVATPGEAVAAAIDECAARGVKVAIVMSSGYAETADARSADAERALVRRARAAGMRIVGPNSQGLANFGSGAVASFSTMFLESEPVDGPVAVLSQSGMMSVVPYGHLRRRGIGVRHSHATGNEADVTMSELAMAVLDDPEVRLLLLYIESIRCPDMLAAAAAIARERDVPIVAVKTGRTSRGQAAARSHTAALANEDRVVDAFFRRHGIWRVDDIDELVRTSELYLKGWRPTGRNLVVVSNSGASCVLAADATVELGLELPRLAPTTVDAVASQLPSFATATNPIDLTAALLTDSRLFGRILEGLATDPAVDLCLVAIPVAGTGYDVPLFARDAAAFMTRTGKVLVVAAPQDSVASEFRRCGVPAFGNQTEAMAALAQLVHHTRLMRQRAPDPTRRALPPLPPGDGQFLSEDDSLGWLDACGMPVVPRRRCSTAGDAVEALRAFGGSVAMKGCASAVPHKSEHGLVFLGVSTEEQAGQTFALLKERLDALNADGVVLVALMVSGGPVEVVLGARRDPVLGPVLVVGHGGTFVEVYDDVRLLTPPVAPGEVREVLRTLRIAPFFGGVRGEPALDLDALCDAASRLGDIIVSATGVASIDLNPVIVHQAGHGVTIVDALVERAGAAAVATV